MNFFLWIIFYVAFNVDSLYVDLYLGKPSHFSINIPPVLKYISYPVDDYDYNDVEQQQPLTFPISDKILKHIIKSSKKSNSCHLSAEFYDLFYLYDLQSLGECLSTFPAAS
jgi:hypothetical protein